MGWQPAILESELLAAELGKLATSNPGLQGKYYRNKVRTLQVQALFREYNILNLRVDPKHNSFSNYCSGIPGLANYEMPNEVC